MRRPVFVFALLGVLLGAALVMPRMAEAQQPEVWLSPPSRSCDGPLSLHGEGFPANTTLEVSRPEWTDSVDLGEVVTDEVGGFEMRLWAKSYPETCNPGERFAIHARAPGEPGSSRLGVAVYAVGTPWHLEIASEGTCDTVPSYFGSGFPPGERVSLWFSHDTSWAAHDFTELAHATTDTDGGFLVEALHELPCTVVGDGLLITAHLSDPTHAHAGWSTWFILSDHGPPLEIAPAGTGHGFLSPAGSDSGRALALLIITIGIVLTARKAARVR